MHKKRNWLEKLSDFVSGKGFYLVVLICVAAIALSGFYLVQGIRGSLEGGPDDQPVSGSAHISVTPSPSPASPAPTPTPTARPQASNQPTAQPTAEPTPAPSAAPSAAPTAQPTAPATPAPTPTPAALVFTWPVNGSVIADFSVEALAYDETMGDWRTHDGLDISAAAGTQVKATANGTVSDIYEDDFMGTTLVIDHGNGLTSVYSNLAGVPTVKVGDKVTTGAIIGSVGSTAVAESGRQTHLHFAMYQDNAAVDPEDYLP